MIDSIFVRARLSRKPLNNRSLSEMKPAHGADASSAATIGHTPMMQQ